MQTIQAHSFGATISRQTYGADHSRGQSLLFGCSPARRIVARRPTRTTYFARHTQPIEPTLRALHPSHTATNKKSAHATAQTPPYKKN